MIEIQTTSIPHCWIQNCSIYIIITHKLNSNEQQHLPVEFNVHYKFHHINIIYSLIFQLLLLLISFAFAHVSAYFYSPQQWRSLLWYYLFSQHCVTLSHCNRRRYCHHQIVYAHVLTHHFLSPSQLWIATARKQFISTYVVSCLYKLTLSLPRFLLSLDWQEKRSSRWWMAFSM